MIPSTLTITLLIIAVILVAANAAMLAVYAVCGLAALWQLMVALAAAGPDFTPPAYEGDDEQRDT